MRTLIIGGTGLIGRELAASLISSGHQVSILSRNPENSMLPKSVAVEKWDGFSALGWEKLAAETQVFINLAGEGIGSKRWTSQQKDRILSSRVRAGKALVEAIHATSSKRGSNPTTLIQASAVGYYGPSDDRLLNESSPAGSDFLAQVCKEWEMSTQPAETLGVRRVIIRTGLVLSSSGGVLPKILLPFQVYAGGPMGNGSQWYSWIHLRDEVEAIRYLIEHESCSGDFNLTAPHPLSNADFSRIISRVLRRPDWLPAPAFLLRIALGEMSTLVLDGQRVIPQRLLDSGFHFSFSKLEDALQDVLKR